MPYTQSDSLRERTEQHLPKNTKSKNEDKTIATASQRVIEYIEDRFDKVFFANHPNFSLSYEDNIQIGDMIHFICRKGYRKWETFNHSYDEKVIRPDGGVIYLNKTAFKAINGKENIIEKLPLVIAEVKHQGTNDKRISEGKGTQAAGNAIERLGKNLTGIKAMLHYESITPFVCFGDGCDFSSEESINRTEFTEEQKEKLRNNAKTVLAKVFLLNEFYDLNDIHVFKRDQDPFGSGGYSPVSMFFKYEEWTENEMFEIMKEIAEASFRYYIF